MRISLHFSSDIVIWCCFVRNRVGDRWTITLLFWSERKVVLRMKTCSIVAIAITITMLTNGCSTKNQPTMAGNLNDVAIPQPLKLLSRYFPPHIIGTFIWWHVDCSARELHIIRWKRKNTMKKTASSFWENSFSFRILLNLCKCSAFHFLGQIYYMKTVS